MTIRLDDLRESNDFLNVLFERMPSLVMIADNELKIEEINDVYLILFGKPRQEVLGTRCGNALGCAFAVSENSLCGETSNCGNCRIRQRALEALHGKEISGAETERLIHTFFINGQKETKHFEFSTRYIKFQGRELVMLILFDVTELELQKQRLEKKQAKINEALDAAGCIQKSLLPLDLPFQDSVKFAWTCIPCDEIGGDILNVFALDDKHMGFYMLDVAGHGVPSAMISVLVYQLMAPHSDTLVNRQISPPAIREPQEVLEILNKEFPFSRFERHFTIIYGVLDVTSGMMKCSNAAHCPPVILPRRGELNILETSGTIIGLEGVPFGQESVQLMPSDKVVIVSDGLTEAFNPAGKMFGSGRLYQHLEKMRLSSPDSIVEGLFAKVVDFSGTRSLSDDLSLMAFEFNVFSGQ